MLQATVAQPKIIGEADPAMFARLRADFPEQNTGVEWYRNGEIGSNFALMEVLRPLNEQLLAREVRRVGFQPYAIYYSVDTTTVPAGESQRPNVWHMDQGGNNSVLIADALPTEFLVAEPDHKISLFKRYERRRFLDSIGFGQKNIDPATLEELGLASYTPANLAMVAMRHHVHRSPVNSSDQPLARAWLRAAILRFSKTGA